MKYIIMCGGVYPQWKYPKQLTEINGEAIICRTIRLLHECGVDDIVITSNDMRFRNLGVPVISHSNRYTALWYNNYVGHWYEAFWLTDEPVCYIFGDVVFSPEAIKTIVETETDDIEFFASAPPFAKEYPKRWVEPFALKVVDTEHLKQALNKVVEYEQQGVFNRSPIMWEVWQCIVDGDPNNVDFNSYVAINDYTCDIDYPEDIEYFKELI